MKQDPIISMIYGMNWVAEFVGADSADLGLGLLGESSDADMLATAQDAQLIEGRRSSFPKRTFVAAGQPNQSMPYRRQS